MLKYQLSLAADDDMRNIWSYGADSWGADQADHYYQQLIEMMVHLADHPGHGKSEAEVFDGLRSYPNGSHRIYYIPAEDHIQVIRVLHQSMDVERHIEN